MVEITMLLVIKQIVIAVVLSITLAAVYALFVLGVSAHLRENSKNYPEVE